LARLIATVGLTPGAPHTSLCLLLSRGVNIEEVVIVGNVRETVEEAARILRECPCPNGSLPGAAVKTVQLGFPDVRSQADLVKLGDALGGLIRPGDYVDVTGGRKIMAVWAALVALNKGAHVVATIVPREEAERALASSEPCGKTVEKANLIMLA